jgi:peptidoglycan-associated lipoprotein
MRDMIRKSIVPVLVLAVALAGIAGCKKPPETVPVAPPPETQKAEPVEPTPPPKEVGESFPPAKVDTAPLTDPSVDELNARIKPLQVVYFEYDSSDLDDASRSVLQANAEWLKKNAKRTIRIEGHCDERGTIKYNLSLGERRANSVREYLEGLGIAPGRMRIVTYGEERPADPGHDEGAWRKNRRAEFWFES